MIGQQLAWLSSRCSSHLLTTPVHLLLGTLCSVVFVCAQYLWEKGGRMGRPQSAAKSCNDPIRCVHTNYSSVLLHSVHLLHEVHLLNPELQQTAACKPVQAETSAGNCRRAAV